jgi:hypothetical protein
MPAAFGAGREIAALHDHHLRLPTRHIDLGMGLDRGGRRRGCDGDQSDGDQDTHGAQTKRKSGCREGADSRQSGAEMPPNGGCGVNEIRLESASQSATFGSRSPVHPPYRTDKLSEPGGPRPLHASPVILT